MYDWQGYCCCSFPHYTAKAWLQYMLLYSFVASRCQCYDNAWELPMHRVPFLNAFVCCCLAAHPTSTSVGGLWQAPLTVCCRRSGRLQLICLCAGLCRDVYLQLCILLYFAGQYESALILLEVSLDLLYTEDEQLLATFLTKLRLLRHHT